MNEASKAADPRTDKLRIHVQESKNSIDVFRVTPQKLNPILNARDELWDRLDISYGADRAALDEGLASAEVLLVGNVEAEDLGRRAPRLKWVQSIFAGVEKLLPYIPPGITLTNGSGVHAVKAGEFAIGAILLMNNALPKLISQQRRQVWDPIFTRGLAGKTVALLGTGKLAAGIAEHCRHFGLHIIGINRRGEASALFDEVYPIDRLHGVLPRADFRVVTLPNTPATHKIIGAAEFALLPKGAGVVSIGRGQVVDEAALAAALASEHLGGAVLDVFEQEPLPPASPLWTLENAIITPHCGVDDLSDYLPRALDIFLDNVVRYLHGETLDNIIDPSLGY